MDVGSITTSSSVGKFGKAGVTVKSLPFDDESIRIVGTSSGFFDRTTVTESSASGARREISSDATWNFLFLQKIEYEKL